MTKMRAEFKAKKAAEIKPPTTNAIFRETTLGDIQAAELAAKISI